MQGMSLCSSEGNKLIEKIDKALETSRIMKDVECFSYLDRYTGSEDGEKAAERIAKRMEELGIPVEERAFTLEELYTADEILVTSTSHPSMRAMELNKKTVGMKNPELIQKLRDKYLSEIGK